MTHAQDSDIVRGRETVRVYLDGAYKPRIIMLECGCGVGGWRLCYGWRWGYEMGITFHGPRTAFRRLEITRLVYCFGDATAVECIVKNSRC